MSIEWAHDSDLHRQNNVKKFVAKYGMKRLKAAGYVFGLKSIIPKTKGQPLCKACGVWTNDLQLARALDRPQARCLGTCPSTPVSGKNTEHSGNYPDNFALLVNAAFTGDMVVAHSRAVKRGGPIDLYSFIP